jgi:two-component system, NtrC family, sensor kinase
VNLRRLYIPLWMKLACFGALGISVTHAVHLMIGGSVASTALVREQEARALDVARLVARQASNPVLVDDRVSLQELVEQAMVGEHLAWCFVSEGPEVLASSFHGGTPSALVNLRENGAPGPRVVNDRAGHFLDVAAPILGGAAGEVRVGIDLQPLQRARRDLAYYLGLVALLTIGLGTGAAFAVGRQVTEPVGRLVTVADRFDPARPPRPLATNGNDELNDLTVRFNQMMQRLHVAYVQHQQALRQSASSERLVALGSLVAGVAHEVNNPLAGLKNIHSSLRRGDLPPQRQREYLELMGDSVARIEDIVRRLLDFGRLRPLTLVAQRPSALLGEVSRLVAPALRVRKVTLAESLAAEDDVAVMADRVQVGQALLNLILNALFVTPEGGEIRIWVRSRPGQRGLAVADRGPGIPPELRERVLDPFFSTKPEGEGTGLGLTVTRTIADAHHGDLTFEFPEQGGTVVTLWLNEEAAAPPAARP